MGIYVGEVVWFFGSRRIFGEESRLKFGIEYIYVRVYVVVVVKILTSGVGYLAGVGVCGRRIDLVL